jgi:hypothetical protein
MEPFSLKFRGLWVGMALGELYAAGQWSGQTSVERTSLLPITRQLCQNANRWMQPTSVDKIQAFLMERRRSHYLILEVIPLVFLHPLGISGLQANLKSCLDRGGDHDTVTDVIVVVEILAKLMSSSESLPEWPTSDSGIAQNILKTLADFQLTVQRTTMMYQQPEMTILSAALSGFHNGFKSLPLFWRLKLRPLQWDRENSCEDELCSLADHCMRQWAGCYGSAQSHTLGSVAIMPAGQLRPHP